MFTNCIPYQLSPRRESHCHRTIINRNNIGFSSIKTLIFIKLLTNFHNFHSFSDFFFLFLNFGEEPQKMLKFEEFFFLFRLIFSNKRNIVCVVENEQRQSYKYVEVEIVFLSIKRIAFPRFFCFQKDLF